VHRTTDYLGFLVVINFKIICHPDPMRLNPLMTGYQSPTTNHAYSHPLSHQRANDLAQRQA
jgi:hypothetical protein